MTSSSPETHQVRTKLLPRLRATRKLRARPARSKIEK